MVCAVLVVIVLITVVGIVVVTIIPVVVKFAIGVVVAIGCKQSSTSKLHYIQSLLLPPTRVVTVGVVGGVDVVLVVLDNAGFQISNCQNAELVIGADSASIHHNLSLFSIFPTELIDQTYDKNHFHLMHLQLKHNYISNHLLIKTSYHCQM